MPELLSAHINVDYPGKTRALNEVSFVIREAEALALIGESGSGKSTLALALLGLLRYTSGIVSGEILYRGQNLIAFNERQWRGLRGREIAMIPQSPIASLNPALKLGTQLSEAWKVHAGKKHNEWRAPVFDLLQRVSLPAADDFLQRHASQISVGQAQRVLIAMALLHRPRLLISDEPTSSLDAITRREIQSLLNDLNAEYGIANLFISHDLTAVAGLCSRAVILRDGKVVANGSLDELRWSSDPYTQALLSFPLQVAESRV